MIWNETKEKMSRDEMTALQSVRLAAVLAIAAGGVVYAAAVLLVRGLRREDVLIMPKGEKIAEILTKYKFL